MPETSDKKIAAWITQPIDHGASNKGPDALLYRAAQLAAQGRSTYELSLASIGQPQDATLH